ncbi:MAG: 30S ribosomal protein S20 [Patescibacteria group bacterium]|nr:30S ribosomal protein S20 [Patescibacteria group bacterium]
MPIIKSAKKALRQNIARRARNAKVKNKVRALIKNLTKLVAAKNAEEIKKTLILAVKAIDKAAKNHIIPKNTASRKKSFLAKLANSGLEQPAKKD